MNQSKKICFNQFITMSEYTPFVPRGISWSQNSCGCDAALTILYSIWSGNSKRWSENFRRLRNLYLDELIVGFEYTYAHY